MQTLFKRLTTLLFTLLLLTGCKGPKRVTRINQNFFKAIKAELPQPFLPFKNISEHLKWDVHFSDSTYKNESFSSFSPEYSKDSFSIFCFRGNNHRNAPSRGNIVGKPISVQLDWKFKTRYDDTKTKYGVWGGGSGWTGQPLVVKWSKSQKKQLGITDENFLNDDDALEVIVGSLSGDIYFINFSTGDSTRLHLEIDGPIKGTPSVDPRKNGLLYVGQGINRDGRFGAYVFDMFSGKEVMYQPGADYNAYCFWGAFDSNPLIDYKTGTAFWPAENGQIYTLQSNDAEHPKVVRKFKYKGKNTRRNGIESSMATIDNYGFFADNDGNIVCVDLVTMEPQWENDNYDDTDASVVVDKEKNDYFLYVGNEVDKRGDSAVANLRKIDAATGKEIWHVDRLCYGYPVMNKTNNGGILATPLIGKKNSSDLVFAIFSRVNKQHKGELVAVDKKTGKERYSFKLDAYSWASPVDFYDEKGNMYLFFTDVWGTVYILDGASGKLIYKEKIGATFESSPVIINDRIVVGTRGRSILSFKIITE